MFGRGASKGSWGWGYFSVGGDERLVYMLVVVVSGGIAFEGWGFV